MIANRYRKLEGQKLAVDLQLFDDVIMCEDIEANEQSESIVTLKVSFSVSLQVEDSESRVAVVLIRIFKASSITRNARACNNDNNARMALSFALTCCVICAPLPLMPIQRMKEFPAVLRELSVLRELQHPNIVKLRDCLLGSDKLTLVYESFFTDQNLQQYMAECDGKLASNLVMSYMCQLLTGLEYCHAQGLTHGSLKPQALLVSPNSQLKIADFGLAKAVKLSIACYKAPEMLLGVDTYTTAMDIWAVGTILAEMVSEQPLFPEDSEIDVLHKIFQLLSTPTESIWPGVTRLPYWTKADVFPTWPEQSLGHQLALSGLSTAGLNLLQQLLTYDPAKRITAKQALQHQYFTGTGEVRTLQVARYVVDTTRHDNAASKVVLTSSKCVDGIENCLQESIKHM
eukprot:10514-Heterococcus_DN1.PRE.2